MGKALSSRARARVFRTPDAWIIEGLKTPDFFVNRVAVGVPPGKVHVDSRHRVRIDRSVLSPEQEAALAAALKELRQGSEPPFIEKIEAFATAPGSPHAKHLAQGFFGPDWDGFQKLMAEAKIAPKHKFTYANAEYEFSDLFAVGQGPDRVAALVHVTVDGKKTLRVYRYSQTAGAFRLHVRNFAGRVDDLYQADEWPGAAQALPIAVQKALFERMTQAGARTDISATTGFKLLTNCVETDADLASRLNYMFQNPDSPARSRKKVGIQKLVDVGGPYRVPSHDGALNSPGLNPDLDRPIQSFPALFQGRKVEAVITPSKDGTLRYLIFGNRMGSKIYFHHIATVEPSVHAVQSHGLLDQTVDGFSPRVLASPQ